MLGWRSWPAWAPGSIRVTGDEMDLEQFACRAGISERRARALYEAEPSRLPRPDRTGADGRPLWWASTIDAWCARTRPATDEESVWLLGAPPARFPAVRLRREVVTVGESRGRGPGQEQVLYAIVWDTERGHVIYLQPLGRTRQHRDWLAVRGAELVTPCWWSTAVVVMPLEESLAITAPLACGEPPPGAYVYRLGGTSGQPTAVCVGEVDLAAIGRVLGRRVPVWLSGTTTSRNAEQTRWHDDTQHDQTVTVADAVTDWPSARDRLASAVRAEMMREYPVGFAALAVEAAKCLAETRGAHERRADAGPGWYLACRPAHPVVPTELEAYLAHPAPVTNIRLIRTELAELRAVEAELDHDDPRGEAYAEAARLLARQLRQASDNAGTISGGYDYVPVADDRLVRYSAPWAGPVVDAWRRNLTRIEELGALLARRRIRRLIDPHDHDLVREAYHDGAGRHVLVAALGSHERLWSLAEWPVSPDVVSTWTDATVLAADAGGGEVALMALTPTEDGRMRTDPVPLPPGDAVEAFAYGYGGGTPSVTYRALLRCALGDRPGLGRVLERARRIDEDGAAASRLWQTISTTTGPLRLPWWQVQLWARADFTLGIQR